jgi:hypothetical protein
MALQSVNPYQVAPQKEESAWDKIHKGLQIAESVFKIPVAWQELQKIQKQGELIDAQKVGAVAEGEKSVLEANTKRSEQAGAITAETALKAGYVPDEKGDVRLAPPDLKGGLNTPISYRRGDTLDDQNKRVQLALNLNQLEGAPAERKLKEAQLNNANLQGQKSQEDLNTPSAVQSDVAAFTKRMEQAESIFNKLEQGGFDRSGVKEGLTSMLPNSMQSSQVQQQTQAERNFLTAVLRKESGAAISPSEFKDGEAKYFVRAGDSPEVIEQKRQNRLQDIESFRAQAGKAYGKVKTVTGQDGRAPDVKKKNSDPRVQKALDAGYSMQQIQEHLNGKR